MPRHISGAVEGESFRAVITTTRETVSGDGADHSTFTHTSHYGPYSRKGQAQAMVTREKRYAGTRKRWDGGTVTTTVEGYVEVSEIRWRRADEA